MCISDWTFSGTSVKVKGLTLAHLWNARAQIDLMLAVPGTCAPVRNRYVSWYLFQRGYQSGYLETPWMTWSWSWFSVWLFGKEAEVLLVPLTISGDPHRGNIIWLTVTGSRVPVTGRL